MRVKSMAIRPFTQRLVAFNFFGAGRYDGKKRIMAVSKGLLQGHKNDDCNEYKDR